MDELIIELTGLFEGVKKWLIRFKKKITKKRIAIMSVGAAFICAGLMVYSEVSYCTANFPKAFYARAAVSEAREYVRLSDELYMVRNDEKSIDDSLKTFAQALGAENFVPDREKDTPYRGTIWIAGNMYRLYFADMAGGYHYLAHDEGVMMIVARYDE